MHSQPKSWELFREEKPTRDERRSRRTFEQLRTESTSEKIFGQISVVSLRLCLTVNLRKVIEVNFVILFARRRGQ